MHDSSLPSPGLTAPAPPFSDRTTARCACGEPLELEIELDNGFCEECRCRAAILRGEAAGVAPRSSRINQVLDRHLPQLRRRDLFIPRAEVHTQFDGRSNGGAALRVDKFAGCWHVNSMIIAY